MSTLPSSTALATFLLGLTPWAQSTHPINSGQSPESTAVAAVPALSLPAIFRHHFRSESQQDFEDPDFYPDQSPLVRRLGDLNGDGLDELWTHGLMEFEDANPARVIDSAGQIVLERFSEGFRNAAGLDDLDGDGRQDVVVSEWFGTGAQGARDGGHVRWHSGFGERTRQPQRPVPFPGIIPLRGLHHEGDFGVALEPVHDLDGDGLRELAIGCPSTVVGSAGGSTAPETCSVHIFSIAGPPARRLRELHGDETGADGFGASLAFGGDFDGDGIADLAIGAPRANTPANSAGRVTIVSGATWLETARFEGTFADENLGHALAWAPDLDGDGSHELVVSAPRHGEERRGRVCIFSSARRGMWLQLDGLESLATFGASLAVGDLDGDGRIELVVGAPGVNRSAKWPYGEVDVLDLRTGALRMRIASTPDEPSRPRDFGIPQPALFPNAAKLQPNFGASLTLAHLDRTPGLDLAVSLPPTTTEPNAGSVLALSGAELARHFAPLR